MQILCHTGHIYVLSKNLFLAKNLYALLFFSKQLKLLLYLLDTQFRFAFN